MQYTNWLSLIYLVIFNEVITIDIAINISLIYVSILLLFSFSFYECMHLHRVTVAKSLRLLP